MRLSKSLCAVVGDVIAGTGSHAALDMLFLTAGAPGEPPSLAHYAKWKEWLFQAGQDPNTDSLVVLGNVLEEFMDLPPGTNTSEYIEWQKSVAELKLLWKRTDFATSGLVESFLKGRFPRTIHHTPPQRLDLRSLKRSRNFLKFLFGDFAEQ
jgi:hypothetical protein